VNLSIQRAPIIQLLSLSPSANAETVEVAFEQLSPATLSLFGDGLFQTALLSSKTPPNIPVDFQFKLDNPSPSLQFHYRIFNTTTG
jgi:hypothetical protein